MLSEMSYAGRIILLLLLAVTGLFVFGMIGQMIATFYFGLSLSDMSDLENPLVLKSLKLTQLLSAIGAFILPPLVYAKMSGREPAKVLSLDRAPQPGLIIGTLAIMLMFLPAISWLAEWNMQMQLPEWAAGIENWMRRTEDAAAAATEALLQMDGPADLVFNLFLIAVIPAIGEELLFRGALQKLFEDSTRNKHLGVWITAILFSAFHLQFYGFVPRMLMGAAFGYLLMWSGSLWYPIVAHFTNNAASVLIVYFIGKEALDKEVENFGASEGNPTYVLIGTIMAAMLLFQFYRNQKRRPG